MSRSGSYHLNPALVTWAMRLSADTPLKDSERRRWPIGCTIRNPRPGKPPSVAAGTHMTGDTFFHGPGLSAQAQYIAKLYGVDDYLITEMEGTAITQVIARLHGTDRVMALRGAVNFDQGNPNETTLQHLDPAPARRAGGFAEDGGECRTRRRARGRPYRRPLAALGQGRAALKRTARYHPSCGCTEPFRPTLKPRPLSISP
ncbi:MAG: hypothetical protein WDN69_26070 [Aliidongia sp.]